MTPRPRSQGPRRAAYIATGIALISGAAMALGMQWFEVLIVWSALGFCALIEWAMDWRGES